MSRRMLWWHMADTDAAKSKAHNVAICKYICYYECLVFALLRRDAEG
jgi:hypothetical protein